MSQSAVLEYNSAKGKRRAERSERRVRSSESGAESGARDGLVTWKAVLDHLYALILLSLEINTMMNRLTNSISRIAHQQVHLSTFRPL